MSSDQKWRVYLKNMEVLLRVGIYDAEKKPQRIIVNATVESRYPANPQSIAECFSYENVYKLVRQWPQRQHTALLESYVTELLGAIFRLDDRVTYARVSLCKPDIFPEAESAGVEAEWTRADFERLSEG